MTMTRSFGGVIIVRLLFLNNDNNPLNRVDNLRFDLHMTWTNVIDDTKEFKSLPITLSSTSQPSLMARKVS
jgi:hypothetical protein